MKSETALNLNKKTITNLSNSTYSCLFSCFFFRRKEKHSPRPTYRICYYYSTTYRIQLQYIGVTAHGFARCPRCNGPTWYLYVVVSMVADHPFFGKWGVSCKSIPSFLRSCARTPMNSSVFNRTFTWTSLLLCTLCSHEAFRSPVRRGSSTAIDRSGCYHLPCR